MGTPNYVAPEVIERQELDDTIDNFSIGVIMFYILSGSLPFDSVFSEDIARNTVECVLPLESGHWRKISDSVHSY